MSGSGAPTASPPSAEQLQRLCDFIYRRTGITYGEGKRAYIERRLAMGLERSGAPSFSAYMALLRVSPDEAEQLINSITVNETYFYREEHQLRCLGRSLLPEIVTGRGPGDLVRLWSMPCSTGEEPYSLAIWLLENWALVDAYNIEIVGSDLDTEVLQAAQEGRYGRRSLSRLSPGLVEQYFEPMAGGRQRIIKDLRESVRFTVANLVDPDSVAAQGRFDVVFCRNLLIYFDETSRQLAARHLHAALNPGGFLCLGHSESMARISDSFVTRRFEDAIVYQRPVQP
jgi:chemotaxis protein methyltransferase CheR